MYMLEKEENKRIMLEEMKNNCWETELDESSSYEEIEEAYNEMQQEFEAIEDSMYQNGRDYDAEDFED